MVKKEREEERENRIRMEAIVDAYGAEEQALGWYYYLEEKITFPFKARCIRQRATSPLRSGEVLMVDGMSPEDDCSHEMFVTAKWKGRSLALPLSQLEAVEADEEDSRSYRRLALLGGTRIRVRLSTRRAVYPHARADPDQSDQLTRMIRALSSAGIIWLLDGTSIDLHMKEIVLTRDEALQRLLASEPEIRAFGVRRLALFGSVLRGEAHIGSDVDLLVEFYPGAKTYTAFLDLCDFLEMCLGKTVELVTRESLSPYVGPHILSEAQDVLRAA